MDGRSAISAVGPCSCTSGRITVRPPPKPYMIEVLTPPHLCVIRIPLRSPRLCVRGLPLGLREKYSSASLREKYSFALSASLRE